MCSAEAAAERGEGAQIGIFVGETNRDVRRIVRLQAAKFSGEVEPGAAGAGTEIDDGQAAGFVHGAFEQGGDGGVSIGAAEAELQGAGDFVAKERREPGLFVKLDKLEAAHVWTDFRFTESTP